MKFAVQNAALSEAIHVGRLSPDGGSFAEKEAATDMVLAAVAQYVESNFNGGVTVDFPGLGIEMTVRVNPTTKEADRG